MGLDAYVYFGCLENGRFLGPNGSSKSTVIRMLPGKRLDEPPEPSPRLSAAMPWVSNPQIILRPEGAQEP